jgi:hypothetical protein
VKLKGERLPLLIQQGVEETHGIGSVGYLEHGLAVAERLTAHAHTRTLSLALDALGNLTIPPSSGADDQAHLRTLASLYLTSQLELASLLPAVELLAGIGVGGGMSIDLGPASSKLMDFWRHRKERFSPEERRGLFERLFDSNFENLMISLCEALYKLDEGVIPQGRSNPLEQAKVRTLGEQLSDYLLNQTTGESTFAANDILSSTRAATEILKDPRVERAFGVHTIWMTVSAIMRRYGQVGADPISFVVRGKAGLTILSWLADARGALDTSTQPLVGLDNPVIAAAVDWLQSSLAIEQSKTGLQTPAASAPPPTGGA